MRDISTLASESSSFLYVLISLIYLPPGGLVTFPLTAAVGFPMGNYLVGPDEESCGCLSHPQYLCLACYLGLPQDMYAAIASESSSFLYVLISLIYLPPGGLVTFPLMSAPTKKVADASLILSICVWLVILVSRKWAARASRSCPLAGDQDNKPDTDTEDERGIRNFLRRGRQDSSPLQL
jgi:hypothetical protein